MLAADPARFPDTITRRRVTVMRNNRGRLEEGDPVDMDFAASIQPISVDLAALPEGRRAIGRWRVYIPAVDVVSSASDTATTERFLIDAEEYNIEDWFEFRGSHTRIDLVSREAL